MSPASYEEPCKISGVHCTFETAGLILADSARPHYREQKQQNWVYWNKWRGGACRAPGIVDEYPHSPLVWRDAEWLDLLHPFTAVKNLYLSRFSLPHIAPALQESTVARTTEVLPALQKVLLEGFQSSEPVHEDIARFISVRQLTNQPVAISAWDREPESKWDLS